MENIKYQGNYIKVTELEKDGQTWEKAYFPNSMVVFPITEDNQIYMVKERRPHEKEEIRLKFITGHIDKGESPIDCAFREMQEEAGIKAQNLEQILVHSSSGTINSNFYYILATDISPSKLPNPDGENTIVEVIKMPLIELKNKIYNEEFKWTLACLGLFRIFEKLNI
ncbi:MAG: NUDIX hydrolase [Bacteriovoracaceae bacterium]|jgi:ADP-ribose pyrophosphatase|nr:NUDIX hydrolase [Bacteriovoracaceae bacterium]